MKSADKTVGAFSQELDNFFTALPKDFLYSVEIRNKNFLHPDYFDVLKKHNVAHVFNQWSYMPPISQQLNFDAVTADFNILPFFSQNVSGTLRSGLAPGHRIGSENTA